MFTLFQFMTLDDWSYVFVLVTEEMPAMKAPLIGCVVLSAFVLLSLLTGSMVEHVNQVTSAEEEDGTELSEAGAQELSRKFGELFQKWDGDGDAKLGKAEFGQIFDTPSLARELAAEDIQLSGEEAIELFPLFDKDGDGLLSAWDVQRGLRDYRQGLTMRIGSSQRGV